MPEIEWEVVDEIAGSFQAEIVRGLMEAQGIRVILSQEGVGQFAYGMTVGRLGKVQVLVPKEESEFARQVIEDYYAGAFEAPDEQGEDTGQEAASSEGEE